MHSLITQKKNQQKKKRGIELGPPGHEATALQHLLGEVDSSSYTEYQAVYGECTCDKMADLMRTGSK